MRRKTLAFIVLLTLIAGSYVVTSSQPLMFEAALSLDVPGFLSALGNPVFALCEPLGGGPGSGGDN